MVAKPFIPRFIVGSTFAFVASVGTVTSAIALPTNTHLSQTPDVPTTDMGQVIAQQVDVSETQTRVQARVASIDRERGFIRVNIEDEDVSPNVDTIYLSENDMSRLGLNENEELTVVYQNEQAVALIRNEQIVRLQTGEGAVFIAEEEESMRPDLAQTTPTPTPTPTPAPTPSPLPQPRPQPEFAPPETQPSQPFEQQPAPTIQEPVPGLW